MRLGIDVGGTFTDLVLFAADGKYRIEKVLSNAQNPFEAIREGLEKMNVSYDEIDHISYGTTIATNCVLEKKGAKTGLLCTRGFRDILEHQRWHRRTLYDLHQTRPAPLVHRRHRLEIAERASAHGDILIEVDEESVLKALEIFRQEGIESVAICFLNAHACGENEQYAKRLVIEKSDVKYLSVSSEVAPLIREWERTSTTVVNAYTQPTVHRHLQTLQQQMEKHGLQARLDIMQSNGGIISPNEAISQPVRTILSGPAGGVTGCQLIGESAGIDNLITLDMGGTSCDVSVISNGAIQMTKEGQVEYNVPLMVPMIDIKTIGAGGGSIAWLDRGGVIKVGPHSAGAHPGPASYGWGGQEPTVTDAHLVLGRLAPDGLLRGRMKVDKFAAEEAFQSRLCSRLGLDLIKTCSGVIRITNVLMAEAIRLLTTDQGLDPRDFTLLPFGGAGPLHACELALELGIDRLIIPTTPGVLSARGLAGADVRTSALKAVNRNLNSFTPEDLNRLYLELESECSRQLDRHRIGRDNQLLSRTADLRYPGQSFEVSVPLPRGPYNLAVLEAIATRFHQMHQSLYKYSIPAEPIFMVNLEVTGVGRTHKPFQSKGTLTTHHPEPTSYRHVFYLRQEQFLKTPIYERETLIPGQELRGPAIVDQFDTTLVLLPEFTARVDANENLILESAKHV